MPSLQPCSPFFLICRAKPNPDTWRTHAKSLCGKPTGRFTWRRFRADDEQTFPNRVREGLPTTHSELPRNVLSPVKFWSRLKTGRSSSSKNVQLNILRVVVRARLCAVAVQELCRHVCRGSGSGLTRARRSDDALPARAPHQCSDLCASAHEYTTSRESVDRAAASAHGPSE